MTDYKELKKLFLMAITESNKDALSKDNRDSFDILLNMSRYTGIELHTDNLDNDFLITLNMGLYILKDLCKDYFRERLHNNIKDFPNIYDINNIAISDVSLFYKLSLIYEDDKISELCKTLYLRLSDVLKFARLLRVNFSAPLKYEFINNALNNLEKAED